MALLLLPLLAKSTASGTFSHSPLLATYSAPAEPLVNTGVEISPALASASSAGLDHNWISPNLLSEGTIQVDFGSTLFHSGVCTGSHT